MDIGAFPPHFYSNTKLFHNIGWSGINIEPNPDHIGLFNAERANDINLNIAIGLKNQCLTYYKFNQPALNTFDEQHAALWSARAGFNVEEEIKINTEPLHEVLEKWLPKGQHIDFVTIDAEGWDLKVLQSNDWNKYLPVMIIVEEDLYSLKEFTDSAIFCFLTSKNYSLWTITGNSLLFRDKAKNV